METFRDDLVATAAELGHGPDAFRPLDDADAAAVAAAVEEVFGDAANWPNFEWWHSDRPCSLPQATRWFRECGCRHLVEVAPDPAAPVWLLARNGILRGPPALVAFESTAAVVQAVWLESPLWVQFIVCGRQLDWLFVEDYRHCVSVAGAGAVERLLRVIEPGPAAAPDPFDAEACRVVATMPKGPRLVVIGSTCFWGPDSLPLCKAIAARLAGVATLVAVTGGLNGAGLSFGRALADARRAAGQAENLFHLLPRGCGPCESGVTLGAGIDYRERREVLGRVGHAYLVIEGGPGTGHEAAVASRRGVPVIPLARTGGHARELHRQMGCPPGARLEDWKVLADAEATHAEVVAAVGRLVVHALASYADLQRAAPP